MRIIWCMIPEIWSAPDRIFLSSWANFCSFTPITARKIKIKKKKTKIAWRYHHFTQVYLKLWLSDVQFLIYGARRSDGQRDWRTDGRKKWHIEVVFLGLFIRTWVTIYFPLNEPITKFTLRTYGHAR